MDCIKLKDFKDICRICLLICDKKFLPNLVLYDIYNKLSEDIPFETNELPQQICSKCSEKINEIYVFSNQCKKANSCLTKCLEFKNVEIKEELENTNIELKQIKKEITIDEHNIEFVNVEELNLTNEAGINEQIILENTEVTMNEKTSEIINIQNYAPKIKRRHLTEQQKEALLAFMLANGDFCSSAYSLSQGRRKKNDLLTKLAAELNSISGGVSRTPKEWVKCWVDLKSKTKNKATSISRHLRESEGGPPLDVSLTPWEERLIGLMSMENIYVLNANEVGMLSSNLPEPSSAVPLLAISSITDPSLLDLMETSSNSQQQELYEPPSILDSTQLDFPQPAEEANLSHLEYVDTREPEIQQPTNTNPVLKRKRRFRRRPQQQVQQPINIDPVLKRKRRFRRRPQQLVQPPINSDHVLIRRRRLRRRPQQQQQNQELNALMIRFVAAEEESNKSRILMGEKIEAGFTKMATAIQNIAFTQQQMAQSIMALTKELTEIIKNLKK